MQQRSLGSWRLDSVSGRIAELGMSAFTYRQVEPSDIAAMADIRAGDWGSVEAWGKRIQQYLAGEHHPRHALAPRVAFVCCNEQSIVGFIAGHLTRRFDCEGELQWISIQPLFRGRGIASELFQLLAQWFARHDAHRICVDVDPKNERARRFYARQGAVDLRPHWMVWDDIATAARRHANPSDNIDCL